MSHIRAWIQIVGLALCAVAIAWNGAGHLFRFRVPMLVQIADSIAVTIGCVWFIVLAIKDVLRLRASSAEGRGETR